MGPIAAPDRADLVPSLRTQHLGSVAVAVGGLAIVASAFLPWIAHGAGSSLELHDLGDLVLGGSVSAVVPRWVGLVAYLIPVVGAGLIVASSFESRWGRRLTVVAATVAIVLVATAALLPLARHGRPSWGQLVAGVGTVMACAGLLIRAGQNKSNDSLEKSGSSIPSSG